MTDRAQQQELKETKPSRKSKAKAKAKAKAKGRGKGKGGKPTKVKKDSSPKEPKGAKAKAKAKAKQASPTKKSRAKKVKETEVDDDDDDVIPPTSPEGKGNTKKTSYKRPSKAPGSTSKEKPRRSTSSGQAGLEKPSKSSRYTFARRVEPKPEVSKAWWTSLHEAFDKVVKDKVKAPSKLEDGFYVFLVVLLKKGDLKTSNNNNSEGEQVSPRKHNN